MKKGVRNSVKQHTQEIIKMYNEGKTSCYIAKFFGCGETSVLRILRDNNIERRKLSDSCRKYYLDTTYFDIIDTPNKAYILGIWFADGVNYEKQGLLKLSLQIDDLQILEDIKKEIGMEKPIHVNKQYGKGKKEVASLQIYNKHISEKFKEYGCVPNKSLILEFPDWIPENLMSHFLRGYFDGDGSIKNSKGRGSQISFASSTKFCKSLRKYFKEKFNIDGQIYPMKNPLTSSYVISKQDNVKIILDFIYKDADLYMDRKYKRYIEKFYKE